MGDLLMASFGFEGYFLMNDAEVIEILGTAKRLAQRYRELTGKPLGITGEVAEYEAARILGLTLTSARQAGYDATDIRDGTQVRLQIKGRCILKDSKPGQRVGSIDVEKDFDAVLLVLLDHDFEATAIYEAPREAIVNALNKPGSRARNERGSLSVSQFRSVGFLRWKREIQVQPPGQSIGPQVNMETIIEREVSFHSVEGRRDQKVIGDLFDEEPQQWGLRGDPYLWREMRQYFKRSPLPSSEEILVDRISEAFYMLTGHQYSETRQFYVEKYARGGMSSGDISPEFWQESAIRILIDRYKNAP
jgi:hypothetical protein